MTLVWLRSQTQVFSVGRHASWRASLQATKGSGGWKDWKNDQSENNLRSFFPEWGKNFCGIVLSFHPLASGRGGRGCGEYKLRKEKDGPTRPQCATWLVCQNVFNQWSKSEKILQQTSYKWSLRLYAHCRLVGGF